MVFMAHNEEYMNPPTLSERLDWLHSLIQELENADVELPMGDFLGVYEIIEDAREALRWSFTVS